MDLKTSIIIAIVSLTSLYISEWTLSWTTLLAILGLTIIIKSSKDQYLIFILQSTLKLPFRLFN